MARPQRDIPVPYLRENKGVFKLRWTALFDKKYEYQVSLGKIPAQRARLICSATAIAFDGRTDFPEEIRDNGVLKRYIAQVNALDINQNDADLIQGYVSHKRTKAKDGSAWPKTVKSLLLRAQAHIGNLQSATPRQLREWIDIVADANSNATANRAAAALSGFYKWLRSNGYAPKSYNPTVGIEKLREERPEDGIVIWEENEVPELLKQARSRKDGIAVWIAVLAGLRRGEVARLNWIDITPSYLIVQKSKTGKKRQVPLSAMLARELERFRSDPFGYDGRKRAKTEKGKARDKVWLAEYHASGRVVPWPVEAHGWQTAARRMIEEFLPRLLPELYKTNPEKFGWNAFRHTFASRHAQEGLSLDIISAWLGDSPQVCKEHYARYVPKNMRDTRIDAADMKIAL